MKITIKSMIVQYLGYNPGWQSGGKVSDHVGEIMKCKDSNVERRCRELVREGLIERILHANDQGKLIVWYKSKTAANERLAIKKSAPQQLSLIKNQSYE